ncbi:MAG: hypothetical protein IKG01_03775, partial [Lachnospiraceae bacterium]|nr:hypothetical protein [Lachnospiraceae bacterium]
AAMSEDGEKENATMSSASKEQTGQKMTDAQKSAGEKVEKIKKIFRAIIAGMTVLIILFLILLIRYFVKSKHFD